MPVIPGDSRDYRAPIGNAVAFVGGFLGGIAAAFAPAAPAIAGGCAATDCGPDMIQLSDKLGQNVWQMGNANAGNAIEDALGRNLSHTFETIDKFDPSNGVATSIESINLGLKASRATRPSKG
jgi:hypothetical protein